MGIPTANSVVVEAGEPRPADRVGESVMELLEGQRTAGAVGRVAEDREGGLSEERGPAAGRANGAASLATVAADRPRPAMIWASRHAERVPRERPAAISAC